jgi:hypothetical protein
MKSLLIYFNIDPFIRQSALHMFLKMEKEKKNPYLGPAVDAFGAHARRFALNIVVAIVQKVLVLHGAGQSNQTNDSQIIARAVLLSSGRMPHSSLHSRPDRRSRCSTNTRSRGGVAAGVALSTHAVH